VSFYAKNKDFFAGVVKEGKRVRWQMVNNYQNISHVLAYAVFLVVHLSYLISLF
jgi:hypothetical protein